MALRTSARFRLFFSIVIAFLAFTALGSLNTRQNEMDLERGRQDLNESHFKVIENHEATIDERLRETNGRIDELSGLAKHADGKSASNTAEIEKLTKFIATFDTVCSVVLKSFIPGLIGFASAMWFLPRKCFQWGWKRYRWKILRKVAWAKHVRQEIREMHTCLDGNREDTEELRAIVVENAERTAQWRIEVAEHLGHVRDTLHYHSSQLVILGAMQAQIEQLERAALLEKKIDRADAA